MEIQIFQVTEISSERTKQNYPPLSGVEETFILLNLNNAMCFDDPGLRQLSKRGQLFFHRNYIAFVCKEQAWMLLQARTRRIQTPIQTEKRQKKKQSFKTAFWS